MPYYNYSHVDENEGAACRTGGDFDWDQPSMDIPLKRCPYCGGGVERNLAAARIKKRKFNCELRDLGFTKLVRVDDGIFENVTRRHGEEKYIDRRNPETFPDLSKTVKD